MDPADMLQKLFNEWSVIKQAPLSVGLLFCLALVVCWTALNWAYGARIAKRDDTIDDYKRRLEGASPAEAQKLVADLRAEIEAQRDPRLFNQHSLNLIKQALGGHVGEIAVRGYVGSSETHGVRTQVARFLSSLGWKVEADGSMNPIGDDKTGLALIIRGEVSTADSQAMAKALKAGGIAFTTINKTAEISLPKLELFFSDIF